MSIDGPSTDPRTAVVAAIRATTSGDLDSALRGIVSAAVSGLGADAGAILLADPDRTEPQVAASTGFREGEVEALARTTDIAGVTATPLVLDRGGVESSLGTLILRWPDGDPRTDHGDIVEALASLAALATERARETSNAAERSDWFERMSESAQARLDLEKSAKYDRLGLDKTLRQMLVAMDRKRLVGLEQYLPLLDRITNNESYMHTARAKAAEMAETIRKPAAQ